MKFMTNIYGVGIAVVNATSAAKTWFNEPNATAHQNYDAVVNAMASAHTALSMLATTTNGKWMFGAAGVAISQVNFLSSLAQLFQATKQFSREPSHSNINNLIQNLGGTISAAGGAMISAAALSGNPPLLGMGVAFEISGAAMKEGNKWFVENPTTALDPFFEALDYLNNIGHWIGLNAPLPSDITADVTRFFNESRGWVAPRDPLVLDLDGDGIEAVGINPSRPILFDHDGDGTRNATGWI
ncbi:MAG: hypothetical protein EON54_04765, partial [Alcaligenaceae bacterium]